MFLQFNIKKILILLILTQVILTCTQNNINHSNTNKKFESIYGSQVKKILEQKNAPPENFDTSPKITNFNLNPEYKKYTNPSQIFNIDSPVNERSKFATHKLFLKQPQMFLPDMGTFKEGLKNFSAKRIPTDIFELKYNTSQHPPFQITGIDFDLIKIPQKDAYGISSSLEKKSYPLPPRNILAKDIQYLLARRGSEDIEFTQDLISENELIRKQIAVNRLYFDDRKDLSTNKYSKSFYTDNSEGDWVKKKNKEKNNEVINLIRNQVIIKNLRSAISTTAPSGNNQQGIKSKPAR